MGKVKGKSGGKRGRMAEWGVLTILGHVCVRVNKAQEKMPFSLTLYKNEQHRGGVGNGGEQPFSFFLSFSLQNFFLVELEAVGNWFLI